MILLLTLQVKCISNLIIVCKMKMIDQVRYSLTSNLHHGGHFSKGGPKISEIFGPVGTIWWSPFF